MYHDTLTYKKLKFVSILGDTITRSLQMIRTPSGYFGSVSFLVKSNEPYYIIDLLDKSHKILATGRNITTLELKDYKPQDVFIRILIDRNNNGKYDNGDYLNNILPEEYIYIKEPTTIKAGWDIDDIEIKIGQVNAALENDA